MQAFRQLGVGVIIAIASVVLVLGGVFLSLAETLPAPATPTLIQPTFPQSFPTPTATLETVTTLPTLTPFIVETVSPSASPSLALVSPTSCIPPAGWIRVTSSTGDTIYTFAQRYKITPENLSAANCLTAADLPAGVALYVPPVPTVTVIPCGPPAGWVRNHIVQRGDTLFRIALSYRITFPQLQRANCMGSSTTIYAGQRLWVPNLPTRTPVPGVTTVPEFPTATETSLPPTATVPPTDTATEPPTATQVLIPTATNTPPSPPPSQ
jgi:LysM repeat protein